MDPVMMLVSSLAQEGTTLMHRSEDKIAETVKKVKFFSETVSRKIDHMVLKGRTFLASELGKKIMYATLVVSIASIVAIISVIAIFTFAPPVLTFLSLTFFGTAATHIIVLQLALSAIAIEALFMLTCTVLFSVCGP